MPGGARRSLASPVVSGVLCQCGGPGSGAASEGSGSPPAPPALLVEQERRLHSLFLQLDVNRDGALCVHDLAVGLGRLGLHRSERDLWNLAPLLSLILLVCQLSSFQPVSSATCLLTCLEECDLLPSNNGWSFCSEPYDCVQNSLEQSPWMAEK